MYRLVVIALLGLLPIGSIIVEMTVLHSTTDFISLVGKWFTFWAIGARLSAAGLMQALNPAYTAKNIFDVTDEHAYDIIREQGFGNLALGVLGGLSIFTPAWTPGAALAGGLFYGLAGAWHAVAKNINTQRRFAMITDLCIFAVFAIYLALHYLLPA